jgi:hypothetical protein
MNPRYSPFLNRIEWLMENPSVATTLWFLCNDRLTTNALTEEDKKTLEELTLIDHNGYPFKEVVLLMRTRYTATDILELWKKK